MIKHIACRFTCKSAWKSTLLVEPLLQNVYPFSYDILHLTQDFISYRSALEIDIDSMTFVMIIIMILTYRYYYPKLLPLSFTNILFLYDIHGLTCWSLLYFLNYLHRFMVIFSLQQINHPLQCYQINDDFYP